MHFYNKKRNDSKVTAAMTILILTVIMAASSMAVAPALATTTVPASSSGIELSPQPVYREQVRDEGETPINQTHIQLSFSGNGTLNLPNGTEPIRTISRGSGIASMIGTFAGKEILTTEDGSESATVTFYEIVRFGEQQGRGIATAVVETNSTGMLAPLDGMIMVGVDELPQEGNSTVTLWEWQSGIPLPTAATTTPEEPPLMNTTTTTTTNATTAADANATAVSEEEQQQQQTTTTLPAPLLE
jgi:hypothetical protein